MNLFKRHDKSDERKHPVFQYVEMASAAGYLTTKSSLGGRKSKPRSYVPQTKPLAIILESEEVSKHRHAQAGQVIYRDEDYVPAVHEMVSAARIESEAQEGTVLTTIPARTIIQSENMPIGETTGLNIVSIKDDLNRIYGEMDDAAPIIPAE